MNINIDIGEINYKSLVKYLMPILKNRAEEGDKKILRMLADILDLPGDVALKILSLIPQRKLDEIARYLVNNNKDKIVDYLEKTFTDKGVAVIIKNIEIKAE